jgi:hypothetical protein
MASDQAPLLEHYPTVDGSIFENSRPSRFVHLLFRQPNINEVILSGHSTNEDIQGPSQDSALRVGSQLLPWGNDLIASAEDQEYPAPPCKNASFTPCDDQFIYHIKASIIGNNVLHWQLEVPIHGQVHLGIKIQAQHHGWAMRGEVSGIRSIHATCITFWVDAVIYAADYHSPLHFSTRQALLRVAPEYASLSARQWLRYKYTATTETIMRSREFAVKC